MGCTCRGKGRATSSYLKRLYVAGDTAAGATDVDDDIEGRNVFEQ